MAAEPLILSPSSPESPAIHKVTVHPTGKHSLQAAITFDCVSLHNLETLFTQPKTLQSSGRAGSIESMSSDSFLPKALQLTCFVFGVFFFYFWGGEGGGMGWRGVTRTRVGTSHGDIKRRIATVCIDLRESHPRDSHL